MPVAPRQSGQGQVSCWSRIKFGFALGMGVGMCSGLLFGGFNAWRLGLRGREMASLVGKVAFQGGGTFGTFMAIGSGIRC